MFCAKNNEKSAALYLHLKSFGVRIPPNVICFPSFNIVIYMSKSGVGIPSNVDYLVYVYLWIWGLPAQTPGVRWTQSSSCEIELPNKANANNFI